MNEKITMKWFSALRDELLDPKGLYRLFVFGTELLRERVTPFFVEIVNRYNTENVYEVIDTFSDDILAEKEDAIKLIGEMCRDREIILKIEIRFDEMIKLLDKFSKESEIDESEYEDLKEKIEETREYWLDEIVSSRLEPEDNYVNDKFCPSPEIVYDEQNDCWRLLGVPPSFKRLKRIVEASGGIKNWPEVVKILDDDFRTFKSMTEAQ